MRLIRLICMTCIIALLCSCSGGNNYSGEIPDLKFTPVKYDSEGKSCFYLFDDNPEHLDKDFLADGESPSSIAHFGGLVPGVYTVFSYHHRGSAAESEADLFFDVLFCTQDEAEFEIRAIGLDHDWQWNKAWADFSGVDVFLPEYLKTFDCTCRGRCSCKKADGECKNGCACTVRNELVKSDSARFVGLHKRIKLKSGESGLLSELIPVIGEERINEIRHGGYDEPVWLMMEFEIISGEMSVDTVAYTDKANARDNFNTMKKGRVRKEPQFKGIAENAPIVTAELTYVFGDTTKPGPLPVRIFNQKYPEGYIAADGSFATNVNTWKDPKAITAESAESDMMLLSYRDEEKLSLYGEAAEDKNDVWYFDPFHTSLYEDSDNADFVPNIPMSEVDYPVGGERIPRDFYSRYVCNLGNFGVRYIYTFNLKNEAESEKIFKFSLNSVSGQLYRFSLHRGDELVRDDGGRYIMKRFDMDPQENPKSTLEPKERLKPSKYTQTEEFLLEPGGEYTLKFEVVTLTGCDAPMTNILSVE
ncbi:MAG: hypothetical protein J6C82_02660 [Clostridia bacterium]|nr:hypothetical protein [Clostridia bacterium]